MVDPPVRASVFVHVIPSTTAVASQGLTGLNLPGALSDALHIQSLPLIFLLHARSIRLVFLPGGQSDLQATGHLNAMNRLRHVPWKLSFSFELALQAPVLKAWKGDPANTTDAQRAFHHRASCNNKARFSKYTMENDKAVL